MNKIFFQFNERPKYTKEKNATMFHVHNNASKTCIPYFLITFNILKGKKSEEPYFLMDLNYYSRIKWSEKLHERSLQSYL
jgi:hypothetical protein